MNMGFKLAGFDIRVWPFTGRPTTDATEWEQAEMYEKVMGVLAIEENWAQLLNPKNDNTLAGLADKVYEAGAGATLIAIDFLDGPVFDGDKRKANPLETWGAWEVLGLDVCDLNGLFSFFSMSDTVLTPPWLKEGDILRALAYSEAANIKVPDHRPFVVSRIRRLIGPTAGA